MVIVVGKRAFGGCFEDFFPGEFVAAENSAVINAPQSVVIMQNGAEADVRAALAVVVDDDSIRNFPRGIQLITCGISSKNTISVTSRADDKITLSLNRAVHGKSGLIEPLEQPVERIGGFSEYDYMAAFAAELLLKK